MPFGELPLFAMLRTRMKWHSERQSILAENVANANTPGYKAKDLAELKFEVPTSLGPQRTNPHHIGTSHSAQPDLFTLQAPIFETRPSSNSISLEDEMMKVGQNQQDFQAAATLYQRSMDMLRLALGRKGA